MNVNVNLIEQNVIQIIGRITINDNVSVKNIIHQHQHHVCEKDHVWNPATCNCENGKNLASIMDDSVITCDKITDVEEINFKEKI